MPLSQLLGHDYMTTWDVYRNIIAKLVGGPIPVERMSILDGGYSDESRHIFWLYGYEGVAPGAVWDFMQAHDLSWMEGPYASVFYKIKLKQRLSNEIHPENVRQ